MKIRIQVILLLALTLLYAFPVQAAETKLVTMIMTPAVSIKVMEGSKKQLSYQVYPLDASNPQVTFSTSDPKIAGIDGKGVLTGVASGRAQITIKSTDGSNQMVVMNVQVTQKPVTAKNVAHRGLVTEAPENSVAAFEAAGKAGFWGIEFDIHVTKDKQFAVMHDSTIDRTTNGKGYVKDYTFWQLQRFSISQGTRSNHLPTQKIPNLTEVIQICKKYNMTPVIEFKDDDISNLDSFLNLLKRYEMDAQAVIITFHQNVLQALQSKCPYMNLQWLEYDLSPAHVDWCSQQGFHIGSKYKSITQAKVNYAHQKHVDVNVWTITKLYQYQKMKKFGVDYLTMDINPME